MIWGNLRRTLHTREATPPLHPMPSTRSVVAVPVLVLGAPLSIVASSVSLIPPPSRWYVWVKRCATVTSNGALALADAFDATTVIRKLPTGVEEKVVTDNEDVNGGVPLDGETEQVDPGGHPERPSETASAEDPRTVTVDEAVPPGWMWTALGSAETANPADGVFVRVNESITPLELSTNSYRMIVGETWNQPKPLAGGVTRHAATRPRRRLGRTHRPRNPASRSTYCPR